jgi:hypothetical protein
MSQVPANLGQRIVHAARLAAVIHLQELIEEARTKLQNDANSSPAPAVSAAPVTLDADSQVVPGMESFNNSDSVPKARRAWEVV